MSKKLILIILSSFFLITSCATVSEKANDAYDPATTTIKFSALQGVPFS